MFHKVPGQKFRHYQSIHTACDCDPRVDPNFDGDGDGGDHDGGCPGGDGGSGCVLDGALVMVVGMVMMRVNLLLIMIKLYIL